MYVPTPRERPVDDPTLRGRPVDDPAYEPMPRKRPDDVPVYEPTQRERPVDDPTLRGGPVDGPACELVPIERPIDVPAYEPTPRKRPTDDPTIRGGGGGPVDEPNSEPATSGRPADGPKSKPKTKGRPVDPKTVPLMYKPPPPVDLPEWSDSEQRHPNATEQKPVDGYPGYGWPAHTVPLSTSDCPRWKPSNVVGFNNPFFGAPIAFAQCHNTSGMDTTTTVPIYNIPNDSNIGIDQSAVPTVFASGVSPDSIPWSTAEDIIRDIVREGPFDAGATPMETEDSPLISTSMPGCPYRMTSYTGTAMVDADTTYGLQLHHPRFLEFIGAPESARLLNHSPSFWVDRLGQESAMAAAVNLQRDAGFMMSNLQILAQFVMSLHRMSAEMLSIGVDHVVFPVEEVDRLSVMPRAQRAAKYMTAMGLWRPPSGPGVAGPLPTSTCPSCMNCEYCFGRKEPSAQ